MADYGYDQWRWEQGKPLKSQWEEQEVGVYTEKDERDAKPQPENPDLLLIRDLMNLLAQTRPYLARYVTGTGTLWDSTDLLSNINAALEVYNESRR